MSRLAEVLMDSEGPETPSGDPVYKAYRDSTHRITGPGLTGPRPENYYAR